MQIVGIIIIFLVLYVAIVILFSEGRFHKVTIIKINVKLTFFPQSTIAIVFYLFIYILFLHLSAGKYHQNLHDCLGFNMESEHS